MARQAVRLNGCTEVAITKLDVLDTLDTLRVCVAYEVDGRLHRYLPYRQALVRQAQPVYEELPGWQEDLSGVTEASELPGPARDYVEFIADQIGVPVRYVCVGPGREQYLRFAA
jgi:adenylosuccinate synthase